MDKKEQLLKELREKRKETETNKPLPQDNKQRLKEKIEAQKKLDDGITEETLQELPRRNKNIAEKLKKAVVEDEEQTTNILDEADNEINNLQAKINELLSITYNDIKIIDEKTATLNKKIIALIKKGEEQSKTASVNKSLEKQLKNKIEEISLLKENIAALKREVKKLTSQCEKLAVNNVKDKNDTEKKALQNKLNESIIKQDELEKEITVLLERVQELEIKLTQVDAPQDIIEDVGDAPVQEQEIIESPIEDLNEEINDSVSMIQNDETTIEETIVEPNKEEINDSVSMIQNDESTIEETIIEPNKEEIKESETTIEEAKETVPTSEEKKESVGKKILNYFVTTFNGMAIGLFSTLIIGVIISKIGILCDLEVVDKLGKFISSLMGIGIGLGVASSRKCDSLKLIGAGVAGGVASLFAVGDLNLISTADPFTCYLCVIASIEVVNLIFRKKTSLDIILVPFVYAAISLGVILLIGKPVSIGMNAIGSAINRATELQPFIMGVIIAVVIGICLTLPISSAAIAISISLGGIAGGAAVVGCCVQMLGFAVMSRKDNKVGMLIAIGVGTSMLQFKNILKKPIIWLPTIIVSAILGPISTLVFKLECTPIGSGMGTSGLVGQIETFGEMGLNSWLPIILMEIILPIVLVYIVDIIFRKLKLIKKGDLTV